MRTTSPYILCNASTCLCGVLEHDIKSSGIGETDHRKGPGILRSGLKKTLYITCHIQYPRTYNSRKLRVVLGALTACWGISPRKGSLLPPLGARLTAALYEVLADQDLRSNPVSDHFVRLIRRTYKPTLFWLIPKCFVWSFVVSLVYCKKKPGLPCLVSDECPRVLDCTCERVAMARFCVGYKPWKLLP